MRQETAEGPRKETATETVGLEPVGELTTDAWPLSTVGDAVGSEDMPAEKGRALQNQRGVEAHVREHCATKEPTQSAAGARWP